MRGPKQTYQVVLTGQYWPVSRWPDLLPATSPSRSPPTCRHGSVSTPHRGGQSLERGNCTQPPLHPTPPSPPHPPRPPLQPKHVTAEISEKLSAWWRGRCTRVQSIISAGLFFCRVLNAMYRPSQSKQVF